MQRATTKTNDEPVNDKKMNCNTNLSSEKKARTKQSQQAFKTAAHFPGTPSRCLKSYALRSSLILLCHPL